MKEIVWYTREYRYANGVSVKTKFPGNIGARPGTREYKRQIRRAEKLAAESANDLGGVLNNNYRAGRDYHFLLTYDEAGVEKLTMQAGTNERDALLMQAKQEMKNYIRRLARRCTAAGVVLRYVIIASDVDGKTGELARVHHHLVVNKEAARFVAEKWGMGETKGRKLYSQHHGDLTELAEYLIAQTRVLAGEKRYIPSRNMRKVDVRPARIARNPEAELRLPKGCKLIHRAEGNVGRPQRIRYYRPEADKERSGENEEEI